MRVAPVCLTWILVAALCAAGCGQKEEAEKQDAPAIEPELVEVAASERQWTGVAVAPDGRVFVNYPRWSDSVEFSVGQVLPDGAIRPFPDSAWNTWAPGMDPREHFICVQSVYIDRYSFLWILDPANPRWTGVVPGGAKLVKVDLGTNKVIQKIYFDSTVAPTASYLNDVRIDPDSAVAYISESGTGALIVADLASGASRRVLDQHPSTKSEGINVTIGGELWSRDGVRSPDVHCDGIALDAGMTHVYYQALTGKHLYRIGTRFLTDPGLTAEELEAKVELVAETEPVDGIMFGPEGNLYLSSLQDDAIKRLTPAGEIETVVQDQRIRWPDTFARGPGGEIHFTTSQIHLMPDPGQPFMVYKFKP